MSQNSTTTDQWLVFTLAEQKYAIHVDCVRELTRSRDHQIRPLPQTPDDIVGALSLRGKVITIRDLRTMINLPSLAKETAEVTEILEKREEDHVNWINELRSSVHQDREFTLARDPHKCAFGRWYDSLMADESALQMLTNSNFTLYRLIGQMDAPHKIIHSIADKVSDLVREKEFDKAHALIDETGEVYLGNMIGLMHQIRGAFWTNFANRSLSYSNGMAGSWAFRSILWSRSFGSRTRESRRFRSAWKNPAFSKPWRDRMVTIPHS